MFSRVLIANEFPFRGCYIVMWK